MTFTTSVVPFAIAAVIVLVIAMLLKINIRNNKRKIVAGVVSNVCSNLSVTSRAVERVINMNSIPNNLLRDDKSISCLDYLCIREGIVDGVKNEDTILECLGGII